MKKENSNKDNLAIHTLVVFRRAERKLQSVEGKVVKAHHLTPMQFGVLEVLYTNGPLHVGDIIEKMLSTSGNMTVVIKNMEREGYIYREEDPKDKRSFLISLTSKGREKIEEVLPEHVAHIKEVFQILTEDEQKELIKILKKFKNL